MKFGATSRNTQVQTMRFNFFSSSKHFEITILARIKTKKMRGFTAVCTRMAPYDELIIP